MLKDYIWQLVLTGVVSYLIGCVNAAILLSKKFKKTDIRTVGSKNPGTTNMYRVFGLKMGVVTLIFDALKGAVPTLAAFFIFKAISQGNVEIYAFASYLAALCATLGHIFPVFTKFRGGKGFATSIGVLLALQPIPTLCICVVGIVLLLITDKMSIFALFYITAELIFHIVGCFVEIHMWGAMNNVTYPILITVILLWIMIVYAHRGNIERLIKGEENNMGLKKALFKKKCAKKEDVSRAEEAVEADSQKKEEKTE